MSDELTLIEPGIVPIRALTWLARAGVHSTAEVHEHIRNDTLQALPGIGPQRELKIVMWYTDSQDWPKVRERYGKRKRR